MNIADEIKKDFSPVKWNWHGKLADYLKKHFADGLQYVWVYGCYGREWCDSITESNSFNIHSVHDWLVEEGFTIVEEDKYGGGDHQFKIMVRV